MVEMTAGDRRRLDATLLLLQRRGEEMGARITALEKRLGCTVWWEAPVEKEVSDGIDQQPDGAAAGEEEESDGR